MSEEEDLVLVTLTGVQDFIAASRTTSDLHSASRLTSMLTAVMCSAASGWGRLVLPSASTRPGAAVDSQDDARGLPNRVVLLVPDGRGRLAAAAIKQAVLERWAGLVARLPRRLRREEPAVLGFPNVQWVVVGGVTPASYVQSWRRASEALNRRKWTRDFPPYRVAGWPVCALSARWSSIGADTRSGEELSTVAHVKRAFRMTGEGGFPSTRSLASADYRAALAHVADRDEAVDEAIGALRHAVDDLVAAHPPITGGSSALPGLASLATSEAGRWLLATEGAWAYPETWDPVSLQRDSGGEGPVDATVCARGRAAASALLDTARTAGIRAPSSYLAVIVQDADHMGRALARPPSDLSDPAQWHEAVSQMLVKTATAQWRAVEAPDLLGRTVYAGGDDLLCFVPAATALDAAAQVNNLFDHAAKPRLPGVSASTAVVYFHASTPLQAVVTAAQELLAEAKELHRPGFGVAVWRRGGERARMVVPWSRRPAGAATSVTSVSLLTELTAAYRRGLSPRLASRLETDREPLASLSHTWRAREITRLMGRHNAPQPVTELLAGLTHSEQGSRAARRDAGDARPPGVATDAALVARFIASEALGGVGS